MSLLTTDLERINFLEELDNADFEVTGWEAAFIDTQLRTFPRDREHMEEGVVLFSEAQRKVIDRMLNSYQGQL